MQQSLNELEYKTLREWFYKIFDNKSYKNKQMFPKNLEDFLENFNKDHALSFCINKYNNAKISQINASVLKPVESILKKLDIWNLKLEGLCLEELPSFVLELKNLQTLSLYENNFWQLDKINELKNLKKLNLAHNCFCEMPPLSLPNLTHLSIYGNLIENKNEADSIGLKNLNTPNLKKLNLSKNALNYFPRGILELKNLKKLNLSSNKITSLPSLLSLQNLKILNLSCNALSEISKELTTLPNLEYLDISYNKLTSLDTSFYEAKFELIKEGNKIPLTDYEKDRTSHLTQKEFKAFSTWLWNNCHDCGLMLEDMLDEFMWYDDDGYDAPELKEWLLQTRVFGLLRDCPEVHELPKELGKLKGLQKIDVSYHPIKELPSTIFGIKSLEYLDISDTDISELSSEIKNLEELRLLDISGTSINSLPKEILECKKLEHILVDEDFIIPKNFPKNLIKTSLNEEEWKKFNYN